MRFKIVKTLLIQVKSNNASFVAMGLSYIQMATKGHFLYRPIGANLSNHIVDLSATMHHGKP